MRKVTFLGHQNGLFLRVLSVELEIIDDGLHLQHQRVDLEEFVPFTSMMEVEELVSNSRKPIILKVVLVCVSNCLLSGFSLAHKIYTQHTAVSVVDVVVVLKEGLVGELERTSDLGLSGHTSLLEEDWYTASDLNVGAAIPVVVNNLL